MTLYDPFARFETATLSNGLSVHFQHFDVPWIFARFLVHVGARDDPPEYAGICHLLEHLVGENIPGMTNEQVRAQFIEWGEEPYMGELGYLGTWYGFRVPAQPRIIRRAFEIFGSFLLRAQLEAQIFEQRQTVVNELLDEDRLRFLRELHTRGFHMQFPGHRLGNYCDVLGTVESVMAIHEEQLQAFYDRYYVPANMEIVAAGGCEMREFTAMLQESVFASFKLGGRNPALPPATPPVPTSPLFQTSLSRRERIVSSGQLEMVEYFSRGVMPGWISYEAARLFCNILEEVLFRELREKRQFTYGFLADLRLRQEFHFLEIQGYVPLSAVGQIGELIDRCIEISASDASLFARFRAGVLGAVGMHDTAVDELVEDTVHRLRVCQRVPTLAENFTNYQSLTPADLRAVAEWLPAHRRFTHIIEP